MQVLEKVKIIDTLRKKVAFKVLILKTKTTKNSFNGKILGKRLDEWVAYACHRHDIKIFDFDNKINILEFVKDKLDINYDYTIVLTSSIPLITQETISNIEEYCQFKNINVCKLPVGYVVKNTTSKLVVDSVYSQNIEDFYIVENKKQFSYALSILQDRINTFHIDNGVDIVDPKKVYIEPTVDIGENVIIYPGNSIKGNTIVECNAILKENNVIDSSKIGRECCVSGSVITKSILGVGVCISPFCEINNSLIGNYSILNKGVVVNNYRIKENEKISINSVLGDNK